LLRLVWAFARAGQAATVPPLVPAVCDALHALVGTDGEGCLRLPHAQLALLLWSLVMSRETRHPLFHGVARGALGPAALDAARGGLAAATRQHLHQAATVLRHREPAAAVTREFASPLPAWVWDGGGSSGGSGVPAEADPYDHLYASISHTLQTMRVGHERQHVVDGYAIDVAVPHMRVGRRGRRERRARLHRDRSYSCKAYRCRGARGLNLAAPHRRVQACVRLFVMRSLLVTTVVAAAAGARDVCVDKTTCLAALRQAADATTAGRALRYLEERVSHLPAAAFAAPGGRDQQWCPSAAAWEFPPRACGDRRSPVYYGGVVGRRLLHQHDRGRERERQRRRDGDADRHAGDDAAV